MAGEKGKKTPCFVRFSTVAGNKGSPDLARDVRGSAVKLYTEEGNRDIVGNNIPVFFVQDAIKFPDLIHSVKPAPDRGFPQWDLGVQVFDQESAEKFEFDVLDATKLIPEEQIPVQIVGTMTLNNNVDNFFAEIEQVAFCTQNIVPGIDFSDDPLLQGRNFSYLDTQLKRLGGPNFTHIPINAPKVPVRHFQQDGHMAITNPKGRVNYEPNSWGDGDGAEEDRGPRGCSMQGFTSYEAPSRGPRYVCVPRPLPITTVKRARSTSARPRSSRATLATRSSSN